MANRPAASNPKYLWTNGLAFPLYSHTIFYGYKLLTHVHVVNEAAWMAILTLLF